MLTVAVIAVLGAGESPLDRVEQRYRAADNVTFAFTQTYLEKLRGKRRVESGTLWAKRDGRVRWTYREPVRKDFVYNGTTAYMYEPENAQVTLFDGFENSDLLASVRFLWGQGSVRDMFEVSPCKRSCTPLSPDEVAYELTPRRPLSNVDYIVLFVDHKQVVVARAVIFDPLGNSNTYAFSAFDFKAHIPDQKFDFQIPNGVSILHSDVAKGAN